MIKFLYAISVLLAVTLLAPAAFGQNNAANTTQMDFSGIEKFWPIYDILRSDKDPTEKQWDELFETPGYKLLHQKEGRRPSLIQAFGLAYKPSKAERLASILKTDNGWWGFILPHLVEIPQRRKEITEFMQKDRLLKLAAKARMRAQEFLPDNTVSKFSLPPIAFFFYSSRGYSESLLLDPLEVMNHADPVGIVGHEFHHNYRGKIGRKNRDFGEDLLPWVFVNVETEGVAGLADKRKVPKMSVVEIEKSYGDKGSRDYFKQYKIDFAKSNDWLKHIEKSLEQIADAGEKEQLELGKKLHAGLPDNGRVTGTYMSEVIIAQLGRKKFLSVVGDPFGFWLTYNEAAARTKGKSHVLSDKAIKMIITVRDKYQIK